MSVALSGPFIQARGYTRGRAFREAKTVKWIGVHTAEGATDEIALGNFFRSNGSGSSHAGIGQDGGYAQYVNYGDTAWTNPPLNEESDTVELCGFARWSREEWLARPAMLDTLAAWIAWRCAVRGIPVVLLSAGELAAGHSGVVMHRTVNDVYHKSSHWDPGYNLPWDVVMSKAQGTVSVPVQPNPVPVTTDWVRFYNVTYTVDQIKAAQAALNRRGYSLDVDGIRGPKTQAAVKDFQSKNGLTVDGWPGPKTMAALNSSGLLVVDGIEGKATVTALQNRLRKHGIDPGPVDGIRGKATNAAEQLRLIGSGHYKGSLDGIFGVQSIKAEQSYLRDLGFYKGAIDGIRGKGTISALQQSLNADIF